MEKTWQVSVMVNGETVLTIGDNHLSGLEDIARYTGDIRNCGRTFDGFHW